MKTAYEKGFKETLANFLGGGAKNTLGLGNSINASTITPQTPVQSTTGPVLKPPPAGNPPHAATASMPRQINSGG